MKVIHGKKALVTGAASGIGRAIALRLAREGADLFLLDIDEPHLAGVVGQARRVGVEAHGRRCDVSQSREISRSVDAVLNRWGTLDILVNNAGVCYYGPTTCMTAERWEWLLAVNLQAPVQFIRRLLPVLLDRPEAHLLNVASIYGLLTTPRCAAYHMTKFGLVGLTQALRLEYARSRLGVTALCPGFVSTRFFENAACGRKGRRAPVPPAWLCTSAARVADKAIAAIYRNKRIVLASPMTYGLYRLHRFAPGLFDWFATLRHPRLIRKKHNNRAGPASDVLPIADAKPAFRVFPDEGTAASPSVEQPHPTVVSRAA